MSRKSRGANQNVPARKGSFYFHYEMLHEILSEADRLDRSVSWIMQRAWKIARAQLAQFPAKSTPIAPRETNLDA